ncbi:alpha/beta fold hydrolase [Mesorhizobium sp. 1M-11]|uniref:alpha/beta hydrolase n=1 Tax=Mesorhizobium sp. 1M-11 TaxID=1529006 RepID=UPI000B06E533|nr:alpha/beta fold hydrolase [Mesorhizobium sp. 1M-11]
MIAHPAPRPSDDVAAVPGPQRQVAAARPVTFSDTVALYADAAPGSEPRDSAVLFLSPWGFEEMCTRKLWRDLADRLAACGIPSLRFDYPGTGDALDRRDFADGLAIWESAALAAAMELRRLSGATRLVLIGHGLGATLAATIGPRLEVVDAIVLMAPVVSGRFYLRELAAWSKMVDEGLGLRDDQRITDHVAVAGLIMPDEIAAEVKNLNIETLPALPASQVLMLERPARDKDVALSAHLVALGADVTRLPYLGYDDLVSNPTIAKQPLEVTRQIVEWVSEATARSESRKAQIPEVPVTARLEGPGFVETPLRFGTDDRLFGILCQPRGQKRGATVVYLGTANDRLAGWARMTTETARYLAAKGVASLRFDAANVGDSPPAIGVPEQVLYTDHQIDDVMAAIDLLDGLALGVAMLAGRCSGAYLAFRSAVADERCKAAVVVNPFTFVWDKDDVVDDALRYNARSLEDYGRRMISIDTLRRLRAGRVNIRYATVNIAKQLANRFAGKMPAVLAPLSKYARLKEATYASFKRLTERHMPLTLIYSANDIGLDRFRFYLGRNGENLKRYGNVSVEIIPGADHNISPPAAKAIVRERILAAAVKAGEPGQ